MKRRSPSNLPVLSIRFSYRDLQDLLSGEAGSADALQLCRGLGVSKLYLEVRPAAAMPGELLNDESLQTARALLREEGWDTVGWLQLSTVEGAAGTSCRTQPHLRTQLAHHISTAARTLDEILIDGLAASECACDACRAAKGKRSWAEFRRSQTQSFVREAILQPVREASPQTKVSLLLAPDAFTSPEINTPSLSQLFDRVLVGPGSGERVNGCEFTPDEGQFWVRWLQEIVGRKAAGAALDGEPSGTPHALSSLVDQAVALTLAGSSELILGDYGNLASPEYAPVLQPLRDQIPWLNELNKVSRKTPLRGIAAYLPPSSPGGEDSGFFAAMQRQGVPLRPTPRFPSSSRAACFTLHALADRELKEKLVGFLQEGVACITPGLRDALGSEGFEARESENLIAWPVPPHGVLATAAEESQRVRERLFSSLGLSYSGPPGVMLHLFGYRDLVLHNTADSPAPVRIEIPGKPLRVVAASDSALESGQEVAEGFTLGAHQWVHLTA